MPRMGRHIAGPAWLPGYSGMPQSANVKAGRNIMVAAIGAERAECDRIIEVMF